MDGADEDSYDDELPIKVERVDIGWVGGRQMRRLRCYRRAIVGWRPDVVIVSGRFPLLVSSWLCRSRPRAVLVAVLHGSEAGADGGLLRRLVLRSMQRYDVLLPVSRFTAGHFGLNPADERVTVVNNGVNPRTITSSTQAARIQVDGAPSLVTVGNLTERKGQHNVIRALPAILKRYPDAVYHVIGIPTRSAEIVALAEELRVRDHVRIHGAVSDDQLGSALEQADVFIMLSSATTKGDVEGFGIAILEANLAGVPAVGSTGCGIEDAISPGVSGELVDPLEPRMICAAIEKISAAKGCYRANALDWARGFTWQSVAREYESAFAAGFERKLSIGRHS